MSQPECLMTCFREDPLMMEDREAFYQGRLTDIRRFGHHGMAYSNLQSGMEEFRHPGFEGFIGYSIVWGVPYVLSNPITSPEDYEKATEMFIDRFPNAVFCQVDKDYACLLDKMGFTVSGFGVEHFLDLKDFEVSWRVRRGLRRWVSKLSNLGYQVIEKDQPSHHVFRINQEWLAAKQKFREFRFLARPFERLNEPDIRKFFLVRKGKVFGFCVFDPIYSREQTDEVEGYLMQHLRTAPNAPQGAADALLVQSLKVLKQEGVREVSLGLSPLYRRDSHPFRSTPLAEIMMNFMRRTKFLYHFTEIGEHKNRYQTKKKQTFIASVQKFTFKKLLGILKINHLL